MDRARVSGIAFCSRDHIFHYRPTLHGLHKTMPSLLWSHHIDVACKKQGRELYMQEVVTLMRTAESSTTLIKILIY